MIPKKDDKKNDKSLARNLGEFVGHLWKGVTGEASSKEKPARREVSRRQETETRDTPRGKVTLRRTIIEEVDLPQSQQRDDPDARS